MLSDPNVNDMVRWSDDGETFIVVDEGRFARDVLPQYFRHNQFASFVRSVRFSLPLLSCLRSHDSYPLVCCVVLMFDVFS